MKRSDFLKRIGLGALAVAVTPQLLANDKSNSSISQEFYTNTEPVSNVYYELKSGFLKHNFTIPRDNMDDLIIGDIVARKYNGRMVYAEIVGIGKDMFMLTEAFPLLAH